MSKVAIRMTGGLVLAEGRPAKGDESRERPAYRARLIRAGRVRASGDRPGPLVVTAEALRDAAHLFEERPVFLDHAGLTAAGIPDHPSLQMLAGVITGARYDEESESVTATVRLYATPAGRLTYRLLSDYLTDGSRPDIGLSAVFWPAHSAPGTLDDQPVTIIHAIRHVESVDFVFEPAADGRILAALSTYQQGEIEMADLTPDPAAPAANVPAANVPAANVPPANVRATSIPATGASSNLGVPNPAAALPLPMRAEAWLRGLARETTRRRLASSGLPQATCDRLAAADYDTPEALDAAIAAARTELAQLHEDNVIQLGGHAPRGVSAGLNGFQRLQLAAEALISGERAPAGVEPLSGLRELYLRLSGDYEMTGRFYPERVALANVDTSTMAGLVANALNKRVVNEFMKYPHWWEPAVTPEDFTNLQDPRWLTLGGVGELPTVAEGAAYTEITWDDQTETNPFVKKGGYLAVTLETIDKDDTRMLRSLPRALAHGAWRSLGKAVAAVFTANAGVGPTMSDGDPLFHANHGNVGTTAFSYSAWKAVRNAMRKQSELNSGAPLGFLTEPQLLWVPSDLYDTALELFASRHDPSEGSTTSYEAQNIAAEGNAASERLASARRRIIMCPEWTDTNNWAAQADPQLWPSIAVGYRYGRTPEVFSVAAPTGGLMFTNDSMPVKVRFFFAVGPTDWRGLYKMNVA